MHDAAHAVSSGCLKGFGVPVAQAELQFTVLAGLRLWQIALTHEQIRRGVLHGGLQSLDFHRTVRLQFTEFLHQSAEGGAAAAADARVARRIKN